MSRVTSLTPTLSQREREQWGDYLIKLLRTISVDSKTVYGLGLAWQVNPDGSHRYYHTDSLGSAGVVTDDDDAPVSAYSYDAYGAVRAQAGEEGSFTYTGEQTDPETSFEFLRACYCDPSTRRFLQRYALPGTARRSSSLNRYAYALNNPVVHSDPSGNFVPVAVAAVLTSPEWGPVVIVGAGALAWGMQDAILRNSDAIAAGLSVAGNRVQAAVQASTSQVCGAADSLMASGKLRRELGLLPGDGREAHHLIPRQWADHPAIRIAEKAGWDHSGRANGLDLPGDAAVAEENGEGYYHRGSHGNYNQRVLDDLNRIWRQAEEEGWSAEQVKETVEKLADSLRDELTFGDGESGESERVR